MHSQQLTSSTKTPALIRGVTYGLHSYTTGTSPTQATQHRYAPGVILSTVLSRDKRDFSYCVKQTRDTQVGPKSYTRSDLALAMPSENSAE